VQAGADIRPNSGFHEDQVHPIDGGGSSEEMDDLLLRCFLQVILRITCKKKIILRITFKKKICIFFHSKSLSIEDF
jgi:hypothetical protein